MLRMDGKIALITGAGTGIGRSCMEIFAREGAFVIGVGRRQGPLDEVCATVTSAGGKAEVIAADLAEEGACRSVAEGTIERHGRIDALVNCAAMGGHAYRTLRDGGMNALAETPTEHWHELMRNNLDSTYFMCKEAVTAMRESGGGSIVNIASTSAIRGLPVAHAYAVAKAGIVNMTRQMGASYGRYNIRTNCVSPGSTDTPMMVGSPFMAMVAPDNPNRFDRNPLGRAAQPSEIAYGCLFQASDEASYVNGANLVIDGGILACPREPQDARGGSG